MAPVPPEPRRRRPAGRKDRGRLAGSGWTAYAQSGVGAFSMGWMAAVGYRRRLRLERIGFRGDPGTCRLIHSITFCERSARLMDPATKKKALRMIPYGLFVATSRDES